VTDALGPVIDEFNQLGGRMAQTPDADHWDRFKTAYLARRNEIVGATGALMYVMRTDVNLVDRTVRATG
jgi:hypothetical protein